MVVLLRTVCVGSDPFPRHQIHARVYVNGTARVRRRCIPGAAEAERGPDCLSFQSERLSRASRRSVCASTISSAR